MPLPESNRAHTPSQILKSQPAEPEGSPPSEPCIMLIFGASGDLTKRLLVPALYNLQCEGLLSDNFAVVGTAMDNMSTEQFREKMSADINNLNTRKEFNHADRNNHNESIN